MRLNVSSAVAGLVLALLVAPTWAASVRGPADTRAAARASAAGSFDLWSGVWSSGTYVMTLKTFSGGHVRGVFGTEAADLSSAQLDSPGYDFRGEIAQDGDRVFGVVVSDTAGEIAAGLSVGDGPGFRVIHLTQFAYQGGPVLDVGAYRYVRRLGTAADRARLVFDRT